MESGQSRATVCPDCYDGNMRATLTLDDDVSAALEREASQSGDTLDQVVNRLLRSVLPSPPGEVREAVPFRVEPLHTTFHPDFPIENFKSTGVLLAWLDEQDDLERFGQK